MMDKLNIPAVEAYSESYAKRLTTYFFIDNEVVDGKEMLKFSDVQQVNLFTISELFEAWQQETTRLRSPYFNFEAEEVKEALKIFMDTVSRFIAVRKEHFEPMLVSAVRNTLLLLLNPSQYFEQWRNSFGDAVTLDRLKEKVKYFQVNKFIIKDLITRMDEIGQTSVSTELAIRWINEIIQSKSDQLDNPEAILDTFSRKLPIEMESFKDTHTANQGSFFDAAFSDNAVSQSSQTREEIVSEPEREVAAPVRDTMTEPVAEPTKDKFLEVKTEPVVPKGTPIELRLNERLGKDQKTLNDAFRQVATKEPTLERHLKTRIENIKSAIPLNQKFVFINELFKGDTAAYHQALNELEQCSNYQAATELLMQNYAKNYGWNMEGEEVEAFFEIIERKFY
jgi:hypothetical protein